MSLLDPRTIEAEIQASVDRTSDGLARACLFNIVLFDRVARPSRLAAAVDYLLGRRPARVLHIQSGYEGPTDAQVSARCYPDRRNRGVCFQEVHILNGSDNRGLDPGSWTALLIRDLPVFALAADPTRPLASEAAALAQIADKVIFDSAEGHSGRPWDFFAELARREGVVEPSARPPGSPGRGAGGAPGLTLSSSPGGPGPGPSAGLTDLAWLRLLSLRRGIARAFDYERAQGLWGALSAVDVTGGPLAEATLVALWLASRLGWRLTEVSKGEALFEDARGIAVRFSHRQAGAERRIAMIADGGESIEIALAAGRLRVRQVDGSTSETALRETAAGPLLLQEVDSHRGDPLYRDAIATAAMLQPAAGSE